MHSGKNTTDGQNENQEPQAIDGSAGGAGAQNQTESMLPRRSEGPALSEEDTILVLRNYFHELQSVQIEFEELWFATGQGERDPDEQLLKRILRIIAARAELMELAFISLRMMREFPEWTTEAKGNR